MQLDQAVDARIERQEHQFILGTLELHRSSVGPTGDQVVAKALLTWGHEGREKTKCAGRRSKEQARANATLIAILQNAVQ
jgi:hypothetical protein